MNKNKNREDSSNNSIYKCKATYKNNNMEEEMKLQIRFKVTDADNTLRNVSKTFSNINQEATKEQLTEFVLAFDSLTNGKESEAYIIKEERV